MIIGNYTPIFHGKVSFRPVCEYNFTGPFIDFLALWCNLGANRMDRLETMDNFPFDYA